MPHLLFERLCLMDKRRNSGVADSLIEPSGWIDASSAVFTGCSSRADRRGCATDASAGASC